MKYPSKVRKRWQHDFLYVKFHKHDARRLKKSAVYPCLVLVLVPIAALTPSYNQCVHLMPDGRKDDQTEDMFVEDFTV